jgi:predicted MPP superfamily phosphohydrolase
VIAGGATAVGAALAWACWLEPRRLVIRNLDVTPSRWPASLDGLTIAVVADLHVGSPHVSVARVERIVSRVNDLAPDMVCLLGDYLALDMWLGRRIAPSAACAPLARLRAPLGTYAVLGDHDTALDRAGVLAALEDAGICVLEDAATRVGEQGLWVAGVSETWLPKDAGAVLALVPDGAPTLLLAHSPDIFPSLPGGVALTLAGHTHGGQVGIPALTGRVIPSAYGARYVGGLYEEDAKQLLVHTGIGTSRIPVRFLVPPQIVLLTLGGDTPP